MKQTKNQVSCGYTFISVCSENTVVGRSDQQNSFLFSSQTVPFGDAVCLFSQVGTQGPARDLG